MRAAERDPLTRGAKLVPASLERHDVQIPIGFIADTVSSEDNAGFVLKASSPKGESFVISLIILLTNRGS